MFVNSENLKFRWQRPNRNRNHRWFRLQSHAIN